jgi:NAD(P)-dependent dehydrogenase (short-subunit alcohol dehydrogenase family)
VRILLIGAGGTIGKAIAAALDGHEVIGASRSHAEHPVDITAPSSIRALYQQVGPLDAVICAAGGAAWKPLPQLTDADFVQSLGYKLMGQVNLVRYGLERVSDGGSFTLTSGILAHRPQPNSVAVSLVNAGLEGFTRAAALELPRRLRVNCVSPPWVSETLQAMGADPKGGLSAAAVAKSYVSALLGTGTGEVLEPRG